ncbi:MAG: lamin tail domain-containing protein [Caldilineaceae bacterium]
MVDLKFMNRRQLAFIVLLNAIISLAIALAVAWAVDARRPDPELLTILSTPAPQVELLPTATTPASAVTVTAGEPAVGEASSPTVAPAEGSQQVYTVQAGDSLSSIADRFEVTVNSIVESNQLNDPNFVFAGQRLVIPAPAPGNGAGAQSPTSVTNAQPGPGEGLDIRTVEAAGDLTAEAVQIVNDSDLVVNLKGWKLEQVNGPTYTFGELSLFPGGNIWVHSTSGTDTSIALYWQQSEALWQSGKVAHLLNVQGEQIAEYTVP